MNRLPSILSKVSTLQQIQNVSSRSIHMTSAQLSIVWRRDRRLPQNPTSAGPLTDLPDYSFKDGRPTSLGVHQKARLDRQRALAQQMVQKLGELEFAKKRHQQNLLATEEERKAILNSKLKPKGNLLSKRK